MHVIQTDTGLGILKSLQTITAIYSFGTIRIDISATDKGQSYG